jgi:hypothetical protein
MLPTEAMARKPEFISQRFINQNRCCAAVNKSIRATARERGTDGIRGGIEGDILFGVRGLLGLFGFRGRLLVALRGSSLGFIARRGVRAGLWAVLFDEFRGDGNVLRGEAVGAVLAEVPSEHVAALQTPIILEEEVSLVLR